jgi:ribosomal protein L37AE/L43A
MATKYTHNTRYTEKRLRPHPMRRMDCPACDQYRNCRDTGNGYLCDTCKHDRDALAFVTQHAPA